MKVALVHDYLREYGGAERVLETLHEIFPDAPVYTAYYNPKSLGPHAQRVKKWDIKTSWMQKLPFANKLISPFRIFAPMAFESFDLSKYDVVISSANIYFAKAVVTKPTTLHISYIHTPPRYLYGYATSFNYKKNPITNLLGEFANHFLRIYDFETSQRPDILIANSKNVAERIKKFYRREATVIYPPVDIDLFKSKSKKGGEYFLSVGRLVRGKGIDVIVDACTRLGVPLKVVGSGPQFNELKEVAGKNVQFLGQVKDEEMAEVYRGAKATIVASEDEDFGIVPVESMASGTPVIAVKAGGFLETVIEGRTGMFYRAATSFAYNKATPESLMEVLDKFDPGKFKSSECQKQAEKFSKERFKKEILELIDKNIRKD